MLVHTSPLHNQDVVFDKAALMRHVDNDPELLRDIVNLFLESAPPLLADMRGAIARVDAPALFEAAHALRGSARNFYAHGVEEAALTLELMAQKGFFMDAQKAYRVLEDAVEQLSSQLRTMPRGDAAGRSL